VFPKIACAMSNGLVTTTVLGMAAGHVSRRFPVPSEDTEESTTRFVVSALNAFIANGRPQ
jgi:hypothetical protein